MKKRLFTPGPTPVPDDVLLRMAKPLIHHRHPEFHEVFHRVVENGITVAGGQGEFTGKIFRIAHLGYFDELDIVTVVAGLERALKACGYEVKPGQGVAAVQAEFMKSSV